MYTHVFFDLDRTLWDFETNTKNALLELYTEFNLSAKTQVSVEEFIRLYREYNNHYWDLYLKKEVSREEVRYKRFEFALNDMKIINKDLIKKISEAYVKNAPYQKALFPEVRETLSWLVEKNYKLSVITNGFREAQEIKLQNCEIRHYFDHVVTSECVGESKPDTSIFKYTLELNQVNPKKCIMVGDDIKTDVLGAEQSNIKGVLFDPHNKFSKRQDIPSIKRFSEIKNILLGL
jgi:putative hydrolase of the HAD superfamily